MAKGVEHRFFFSKEGGAAFLSHLDTMRIFDRALRRSGLELVFTRGFNPHVRFSMRGALPVGLAVKREEIVIHLASRYDPEKVASALNGRLPPGFRVHPPRAGEEGGRISPGEATFELRFSGPEKRAARALASWLNRERIEIHRRGPGGGSRVDVRPFIRGATAEGGRIVIRTASSGGEAPRMSDLVKAFREIASFAEGEPVLFSITRL